MILLVIGAPADVAKTDPARVGVLLRPGAKNTPIPGRPCAIDTGAFSGFDAATFVTLLARHQPHARAFLFVTAPDIVGDHAATIDLYRQWHLAIRDLGYRRAFVAQNGCTAATVPWRSCEAVFIGGDTAFQLSPAVDGLLEQAARLGRWRHLGRINTPPRMPHLLRRCRS